MRFLSLLFFVLIHYIRISERRKEKNIKTQTQLRAIYFTCNWFLISFEKEISSTKLGQNFWHPILCRNSENYIIIFFIYQGNFTQGTHIIKKQIVILKHRFLYLMHVLFKNNNAFYLVISMQGDIGTKCNMYQKCLHYNI